MPQGEQISKIFKYQSSLLRAHMKEESQRLHFYLFRKFCLKCLFVDFLCPVPSILNGLTVQMQSWCNAQSPPVPILLNWDAPGVSWQSPNMKHWKWNLYMVTNLITKTIRESIENNPPYECYSFYATKRNSLGNKPNRNNLINQLGYMTQ